MHYLFLLYSISFFWTFSFPVEINPAPIYILFPFLFPLSFHKPNFGGVFFPPWYFHFSYNFSHISVSSVLFPTGLLFFTSSKSRCPFSNWFKLKSWLIDIHNWDKTTGIWQYISRGHTNNDHASIQKSLQLFFSKICLDSLNSISIICIINH